MDFQAWWGSLILPQFCVRCPKPCVFRRPWLIHNIAEAGCSTFMSTEITMTLVAWTAELICYTISTQIGSSLGLASSGSITTTARQLVGSDKGPGSRQMIFRFLHLLLKWWLQKPSCAKVVTCCKNWQNKATNLGQFARHQGTSCSANQFAWWTTGASWWRINFICLIKGQEFLSLLWPKTRPGWTRPCLWVGSVDKSPV